MDNEEKKKSSGIFYAVIGVATLVVAIIGATFAYFSASAQVTGGTGEIQGGTNSALSGALSASVEKINFPEAESIGSKDLVPSNITATVASVNAAVGAGCVADGYMGCHLYKITASSTQDVAAADLELATLTLANVTNTDDWKYIIYKGNPDGETRTATESVTGSTTFEIEEGSGVKLHSTGLTANTPVVYYLLIYVANQSDPQNAGDEKDVTGTYTGTVTFTAANGGQVSATFSS